MGPPEAKRDTDDGDRDGDGQECDGRLPPALGVPAHLMARVFSQLDCVDLLNCSIVCKQWYRDCAELREAWKSEYFEAWNLYGFFIKRETHPPSSTCSIRVDEIELLVEMTEVENFATYLLIPEHWSAVKSLQVLMER